MPVKRNTKRTKNANVVTVAPHEGTTIHAKVVNYNTPAAQHAVTFEKKKDKMVRQPLFNDKSCREIVISYLNANGAQMQNFTKYIDVLGINGGSKTLFSQEYRVMLDNLDSLADQKKSLQDELDNAKNTASPGAATKTAAHTEMQRLRNDLQVTKKEFYPACEKLVWRIEKDCEKEPLKNTLVLETMAKYTPHTHNMSKVIRSCLHQIATQQKTNDADNGASGMKGAA